MPQFILGFEAYAAAHPEVGEPLTSQFPERMYASDDNGRMYTITSQFTTNGLLRYFQESNEIVFEPRGGTAILPPPPPPPAGALVRGIDVSSYQPADLTDLIAQSASGHVVVHLYHFVEKASLQGKARAQIVSVKENGASVGGYSWLFTGYSPVRQVVEPIALAKNEGVTLPCLWLDIEVYQNDGTIPTAAEVITAVQACRDQRVQPGIYTRKDIWESLGNPQLPGVWLWDANWNGDMTLNVMPYGGMTVMAHQYSNHLPDGSPLDMDVFALEATRLV